MLRYALGYANNKRDLGGNRIQNGPRRHWRGDVNDARVALRRILGLLDGVEDGQPQVGLSSLLGGDAAHHSGAVVHGLLAVERPLLTRIKGRSERGEVTARSKGVGVRCDSLQMRKRTCLPVNPWQITRVSLLIHTLALADRNRACGWDLYPPLAMNRLPATVVHMVGDDIVK